MIEEYGDMWSMWGKTDFFVITGNATIKNNGEPVMGRGIAKQFKDRFPDQLKSIGNEMSCYTYITPYYGVLTGLIGEQAFGLFQVKRWWYEKASLSIVERSAYELLYLTQSIHSKWRVDINYPAIGNGGRTKEEIYEIIKMWPDTVHVWQYKETKAMNWGKGDPDKVRPQYASGLLKWLDIKDNDAKVIRLIGDPILWQSHWISIWGDDGERRVIQPMCCVKFDPEELIQHVGIDCILCDDDLPSNCTYERSYDKGPDFRGFALCIDREAQDDGEDYIKVLSFPVTVYEQIERFAQKWESPADDEEGYDLTIYREKKEITKYTVTPDREASPITEDEDEAFGPINEAFQTLYKYRDNDEIQGRIDTIITSLNESDNNEDQDDETESSGKTRGNRGRGKKTTGRGKKPVHELTREERLEGNEKKKTKERGKKRVKGKKRDYGKKENDVKKLFKDLEL